MRYALVFVLMLPANPIDDFMQPGGRARVIAHRGFSGVAPENTLAAFRKAIDVGADMFERDVLLTDSQTTCAAVPSHSILPSR